MNQVPNTPLRILIVDDDEVDRMTVRRALKTEDQSIGVQEADNAAAALQMLKDTSFDCTILDYRLPGTDGLDLLRQIRALDMDLPVIMMTGQRDERLIVEIMKAGATDYLSKSAASPESLMLSVRNAMRVQRAEQTVRESESRFVTMANSAPVLLWMSDAEGRRLFFNQSWLRFTGHRAEQEVENGWQTAIHPDDLDRYLATYRAGVAARRPFEIEYRLKRGDGEYRWILESGVPRLTDTAILVGFIGSGVDLTERKQAEQQLQERTRQALLGADIGIILTNTDSIERKLARCAEAIVRHLDAASARIWVLNETAAVLDLQASAGMVAHADGSFDHIPVAQSRIGQMVRERQPLSETDPGPESANNGAANESIRAMAGFPLIVQDKVVGVVAMFAPRPLPAPVQEALGSISDELALAIQQARITQENERLYQQAQDAIHVREVFLSVASHELKTPLTSLMSNVQLFMHRATRENSLSERDSRTLSIIWEQTVRLNKLIGALLDISRLQNGKLSVQREPMDLAVLIRRLVEEIRPTLDLHRIELEDSPGPLLLLGDELRLEQVIQNLLQNAVKYSPKGGTITIRLSTEAGRAVISITDQGIGIPQDVLPRLFDRFFRAPNAHELNISGMGLGLYVVKEIIGLHEGTIDVLSAEGQGSTFSVRLPLSTPVTEAAR